jgi:hypothetical protein
MRQESPSTKHSFTGWQLSRPPVLHRRRHDCVITLADLEKADTRARLAATLGTESRRAGALRPLHLAIAAVTAGLVAPLAHDHTELAVAPSQLGVVLADDLELTAAWVGSAVTVARPADAWRAGAEAMELLQPIVTASRHQGRISTGTMQALLLDALTGGCQRLQRTRQTPGDPSWVNHFLAGTGLRADSMAPTVVVLADLGPPVEVTMRRVCCVLSDRPSADCCPTCPSVRDLTVRRRLVAAWLSEVDDLDFRSLTGRTRVGRASAHSA